MNTTTVMMRNIIDIAIDTVIIIIDTIDPIDMRVRTDAIEMKRNPILLVKKNTLRGPLSPYLLKIWRVSSVHYHRRP